MEIDIPEFLIKEVDKLSQGKAKDLIINTLSSYVDAKGKEPISRGSTPSTTFKAMNIEQYVGKLRAELGSTRAENMRLTEQVAIFEKELLEQNKAIQLHKSRADVSSSLLQNSIQDVYRMIASFGEASTNALGKDLALRQLGFEVKLKDKIAERLQYKLADRMSKGEIENISDVVLEMVNYTNQLSGKKKEVVPPKEVPKK